VRIILNIERKSALSVPDIVIETRDLTYCYGGFMAVDHINLAVKRGEIYGFLGPNGAGKTTTIRVLMDFIRPSEGTVTILGMDSRDNSLEIRKHTGYIPSELTLWDNWTGTQYIQWVEGVRKQPLMQEAQRLADLLEYDLDRSLSGLSSGMKRKIGLIATLAHRPELLILDEPTTGLDPLMQQVFQDLMNEARAEGRTVFLSSHNLPEVEEMCDRVAIIRQGRIEAVETLSDITKLAFRWLNLSVAENNVDVKHFLEIPGVSEITSDNGVLKMRIAGDTNMDRLIKTVAQFTIQDIQFEHPTLEEAFLTHYGKRDAEGAE
jgi:ABC-2 type transport system ATP-binding protein